MRLVHIFALLPVVSALMSRVPNVVRDVAQSDAVSAANVPDQEYWAQQAKSKGLSLCIVLPDRHGGDDAPALLDAFNERCRTKSLIFLPGPVYNIKTPMTTLDLKDVSIHLFGRLLWTPDIDYWLTVSMPVNFQNQSTVWYFGGDNIVWDGHDKGTLDGNGQVWYDWAKDQGNLPHRPMNINFRKLTNSLIKRMRFVQSQMWTMAITYSQNVELQDIYVNNTSNSQYSTLNTDGVDTVYSDRITFRRWKITSGDDGIALKGNSSNIAAYDCEFWGGQGFAIGSMGQFDGKYEYIENFYARNITMHGTAHVSYLKTWAGISRGYPPNGGGGGIGHAKNIVIEDVIIDGCRQEPFFAWQCENYSGYAGQDCNSSKFKMEDIAWRNIGGTANADVTNAGNFRCSSSAGGCTNVTVENFSVRNVGQTTTMDEWHCENVHENVGFTCNN